MSLQEDARRITLGQELNTVFVQAKSNISGLKSLKAQILAIKNKVENEPTLYTAEDKADVDAVIAELVIELDSI